MVILLFAVSAMGGCKNIPSGVSTAPKVIEADRAQFVGCSGLIKVYAPSRDVADSSEKSYEITFTDQYGQQQDLKRVRSYTVSAPDGQSLYYAMPSVATPANTSTTYSNGEAMIPGSVVLFGKDGGNGRARWMGPGQWEPVPCGF
jgi:hypothetical protein